MQFSPSLKIILADKHIEFDRRSKKEFVSTPSKRAGFI